MLLPVGVSKLFGDIVELIPGQRKVGGVTLMTCLVLRQLSVRASA